MSAALLLPSSVFIMLAHAGGCGWIGFGCHVHIISARKLNAKGGGDVWQMRPIMV